MSVSYVFGSSLPVVKVTSGLPFSSCTSLNYLLFDTPHDIVLLKDKGDNQRFTTFYAWLILYARAILVRHSLTDKVKRITNIYLKSLGSDLFNNTKISLLRWRIKKYV